MAYILLAKNCKGRHIEYTQQDDQFYEKGVGKKYSGTLALQTFNDRPYMRITFADGKNVWLGAAKKFIGLRSGVENDNFIKIANTMNKDYLCHFDFSKEDLRSGKKKIRYTLQPFGLSFLAGFICYDLSNDTGCSYLFPDVSVAEEWAKKIGLTTVEYLDSDGKVESIGSLSGTGVIDDNHAARVEGRYTISDSCIECGTCESECPVGAIGMGKFQYVIDPEVCVSCGTCIVTCPIGAIEEN